MHDVVTRPSLYSRTLRECRELYVSSGELVASESPTMDAQAQQAYIELLDDLHKALVLKVYLAVCEADREWSKPERLLAEVLCHHLWGQWLSGAKLSEAMRQLSAESTNLKWYSLVRPFEQQPQLRDRVGRVDTIVSRMANLVARCDGDLNEHELRMLKTIEEEIASHLYPLSDETNTAESDSLSTSSGWDDFPSGPYAAAPHPNSNRPKDPRPKGDAPASTSRSDKSTSTDDRREDTDKHRPTVEEALAELDQLIGLKTVKHEVRSLTNFLRLQQRREQAGLPETEISLHMVFTGNPGTGKTTVARIVGKVFHALGVLAKGHLIETDRSGLVAEYAGQTGPKTNQCVDSALDGMLFIDEAYSLVAEGGDDPFGREAAQALLKRSEDDRERLVVILAGYPEEMAGLLRSNPGLSSRFNRQLAFEDYSPLELAQIFGLMCRSNHYKLTSEARLKVLVGFNHAYKNRDRHFGNGRAVRNLFEHAVRRMANRLASVAEIDQEELVTLTACDIEFKEVPAELMESISEHETQVHVSCPSCGHSNDVPGEFLGRKLKCPRCKQQFASDWAELSDYPAS